MSGPRAIHALWRDGRTACNAEVLATTIISPDHDRLTCSHCQRTIARGHRGARNALGVALLPKSAPWNRSLSEEGTKWATLEGRHFRVWRIEQGDGWHVEEVDFDGEPVGHPVVDRRYPGLRRITWTGGFYARAEDLDAARRMILAEVQR
jgi:hypothetical protein